MVGHGGMGEEDWGQRARGHRSNEEAGFKFRLPFDHRIPAAGCWLINSQSNRKCCSNLLVDIPLQAPRRPLTQTKADK